MAAQALEIEHGIDHVLDDLGPGDLAVLGDMADQHQRQAAALSVTNQRRCAAAKLGDRAGRGLDALGPECLDRIDDDEGRWCRASKRRYDIGEIGLSAERDRRLLEPETLGAHAHLRGRLFAREINDAGAGR